MGWRGRSRWGCTVPTKAGKENKPATEGHIVKAASWSDLEMAKGSSVEPPAVVSVKTKLVPADYIESLLQRPLRRPKPRSESFFERFPELRETTLAHSAQINALVDVQEDMLRQHRNKGYAKVGWNATKMASRGCSFFPRKKLSVSRVISVML